MKEMTMEADHEQSVFAARDAGTGRGLNLAMQMLMLSGRLLPVGARLQFAMCSNAPRRSPVEVVYAFGLPRDAALRRFRIVGTGFSVMSELKPTAEAVKMYEEGIQAGSLSSLVRQYRDGVVNLNIGNVRPGDTVAVYLEILAGVDCVMTGCGFGFRSRSRRRITRRREPLRWSRVRASWSCRRSLAMCSCRVGCRRRAGCTGWASS
jgi:hypothetical protein